MGTIAALLQMDGQSLSGILSKTAEERRTEADGLLGTMFPILQVITPSVAGLTEKFQIVNEIYSIYATGGPSTADAYHLAGTVCKSLHFSKLL